MRLIPMAIVAPWATFFLLLRPASWTAEVEVMKPAVRIQGTLFWKMSMQRAFEETDCKNQIGASHIQLKL